MNYAREQLGRFGNYMRGLDDRYADAVYDFVRGGAENKQVSKFRDTVADLMGGPVVPVKAVPEPGDPFLAKIAVRARQYGQPIVGGITRYGIPAAGLTAAGMGLADLTSRMDQQTAGTLEVL